MNPEVFRTLDEARGRFGPCALAIGNFDGVHIGHQALIRETTRCASRKQLVPAVLTFDPHPTAVVAPDRVPLLICTLEERLRLLGEMGIQRVFVLPFTQEVARLSPAEFVSQVLVAALQTLAVFVGENFRFGYKQSGTSEMLRSLGQSYGFSCCFLQSVKFRGRVVSSTAIRSDLAAARVARAGRLLGRCFSLEGAVVPGRGIGSRETVPTLNLRPLAGLLVPRGIFVTETLDPESGRRWPSVTSAGVNPTFGGTEFTVETYLLSGLNGRSPSRIRVSFRYFLRPEFKYPDAESLKAQILKDVARANAYWRRFTKFGKAAASIY